MAVEYDTKQLLSLLDMATTEKLVLPNFQREYVWSIDNQQRLVASILTDVPVGSTLILSGRASDYASRRLGELTEATPADECFFLLDGQQRISTLRAAFRSPFHCSQDRSWRQTWDAVPPKLRYSWTLRIKSGDGEEDLFGYEHLRFPDLTSVEPDQIASFLQPERILVMEASSSSAWTHPAWTSHATENHIVARAKLARNQFSVPLWGMAGSDDDRQITETSLTLIAGGRRDELKAQFRAEGEEWRDEMYRLLVAASPALPPTRAESSEDLIDSAFSDLAAEWRSKFMSFLHATVRRDIPTIELSRDDLPRSVAIFEVINKGGTALTGFDLIVAKNARDPQAPNLVQSLQETLTACQASVQGVACRDLGFSNDHWNLDNRDILLEDGSLTATFKNSFLNMLSLLHATRHDSSQDDEWGVSGPAERPWSDLDVKHIKRAMQLLVPPERIAENFARAAEAIFYSWAFLQLRCGIRKEGDLRYKLMVLPLAYVFAREPSVWDSPESIDRLEYWYWSSLFGGAYRERQNENSIADVRHLADWILNDGDNPFRARADRAFSVDGYSDLSTLTLETDDASVSNDVGQAVLQYTLSHCPKDFDPNTPDRLLSAWGDEELEDHHIIPLATATTLRESAAELRADSNHPLNSPMNRTFISKTANREIGPLSPDRYLSAVPLDALVNHFIPTDSEVVRRGSLDERSWREFISVRAGRLRDALIEELASLGER